MQQIIFTIYDEKAAAHLPPFFLHAAAMAIRTFSDAVNQKEHAFNKHPDHYTLFEHGVFDDNTGDFNVYPAKKSLGNGTEFIEQMEINLQAVKT